MRLEIGVFHNTLSEFVAYTEASKYDHKEQISWDEHTRKFVHLR